VRDNCLTDCVSVSQQKSDYIERELKALRGQEFKSSLSYDELSLFYKSFLDSNHKKHMNYNL
jgi:hypothetical protein